MSASKVIVALDTPTLEAAETLLKQLQGVITFYKIGFEFFTAHGWEAVKLVRRYGGRVFLDLKLHDIPNTVAKTAAVICEHEVDMFNVHTLGGSEMMKLVRKTVDESVAKGKKRPILIGVTILTSHTPESLSRDLGVSRNLNDQVLHLASLAKESGLDGVVCSPLEIQMLKEKVGRDFQVVTPGIRGAGDAKGDQSRTVSATEALQLGADFIVVGRPITSAPNPQAAAEAIIRSCT